MIIGYARSSTIDQVAGLEAQVRDLRAAGCEKLFVEQVSSVDIAAREKLAQALDYVREGDTLVVTRLDRLARSISHLLAVVEQLEAKRVALRILDMGVDTGSATGKLLLTLLGAVGEFERSIMLERQLAGIEKAKAAGKYKGRRPTAREKAAEVHRLRAAGVPAAEIAAQLGIGRASAYRILADQRAA